MGDTDDKLDIGPKGLQKRQMFPDNLNVLGLALLQLYAYARIKYKVKILKACCMKTIALVRVYVIRARPPVTRNLS